MAVTGYVYGQFNLDSKLELHHLTNDTFKMVLLDNTYSIDIDSHTQLSDMSTSEISGGNYARATLASLALTKNTTSNKVEFDCADVTFSNLTHTFRWVGIFNDTATNDELVTAYDLGADQTVSGVDFIVTISSEGLLTDAYS